MHRFLRILVHSRFIGRQSKGSEEDVCILTPSSRLLLKDNLSEISSLKLAYGANLWDCASQQPDLNNFFNEAMASDAAFAIKEYDEVFHGLKSLVDVGGGTGTTARAIVDFFPKVKCTFFDLPHVIATLSDSTLVHSIYNSLILGFRLSPYTRYFGKGDLIENTSYYNEYSGSMEFWSWNSYV
ncbi:hypothetical protein GIB67_022088 [Kingdonia uniflora]|uniref:O-methyltransferase C-terminal domain-containing protein n=1 Tax=Kingdonia uniflora TaxID=39325 RepID=A0A7J7MU75_9MAGN|nr:hypothetical protein GIB67_022088 [Kingdonia uniflora]